MKTTKNIGLLCVHNIKKSVYSSERRYSLKIEKYHVVNFNVIPETCLENAYADISEV